MMKITVLLLTVLAFALLGVASGEAAEKKKKGKRPTRLRHVVCFAYKEGTSKADLNKINKEFRALKNKIDGITAFEMGENNSPEGLNDGFTHCYLVTFDSEASREKYLPHPAHKAFVALLKPHLEKVFVIDYLAK